MRFINLLYLRIRQFDKALKLVLRQIIVIPFFMTTLTTDVFAQASARDIRGAAPVVPLASEPPAKLIVDSPLAASLNLGRVVIQYRTENLHIVPVFGEAALAVSPRVGHLHVTVDDFPWRWLDTSNEPLTVNGLPAGPHHIRVDLEGPTHKLIDSKTVYFIVPELKEANAPK